MRWYSTNDLFFLHRYIISLGSAIHSTYGTFFFHNQQYVDACKQYERHLEYGSSLDSSARRSGKSEIRSCSIPILLALRHPDIAIFFFSVEKHLAQKHVRRVVQELERNTILKQLHPDKLWQNPREDAKLHGTPWSVSDGACIKGRTLNRSIQTFEAHALFGGGPIGSGPDVIVADDIERSDKVNTPENIQDLDDAFSAAISLLTPAVIRKPILVISNTRFSESGLIQRISDRYRSVNPDKVREIPAEDLSDDAPEPREGPLGGHVNYPYTPEILQAKYDESESKGEYALQYALSYSAASDRKLDENFIQFYHEHPAKIAHDMNCIVCIDASRGITDPTAIWVWGINPAGKYFLLDLVVRKMDPTHLKFHETIFQVISKWENLSNGVSQLRVEDTSTSTWAELIKKELSSRGSYLNVIKVKVHLRQSTGRFKSTKLDRIYSAWNPMLSSGKVFFPLPSSKGGHGIICLNEKDIPFDSVDYFLSVEFRPFPRVKHDDCLDAGGMIADEKTNEEFPLPIPFDKRIKSRYYPRVADASWMSSAG